MTRSQSLLAQQTPFAYSAVPEIMIKLVSSVLALAAIAAAQSTANIPNPAVFPGGGTSGNIWRAGTNRVQCLYDSSNWEGQGIG